MAGNSGGPWGGGSGGSGGSGDDGRGSGGGKRGGGRRPGDGENPQIPEIDELMKKGQERLRVLMGGRGGNGNGGGTGSGGGKLGTRHAPFALLPTRPWPLPFSQVLSLAGGVELLSICML